MKLLRRLILILTLKNNINNKNNINKNTSDLIKKIGYSTKINEIGKKINDHDHNNNYIPSQEYNNLTVDYFAARFAQANLASKNYITNFVKKDRQILMIN